MSRRESRAGGVARAVRRQVRRIRVALRPPAVRLIYDPAYERNVTGVPYDPLRADRILAFLANERLIRREEMSVPRPAALKNVLLAHAPEYLQSLESADTVTAILGVPVGEEEVEQVLDLQRLMVGGTIQATRWALATRSVGVNLGGGFHHAGRRKGTGFCVFNDVAIAIARLRALGFLEPVLVVDLDLHDGNGTREIFAADPTVHTFSIHNAHWGSTDAVASTSIALGADVGDAAFATALRAALPPVMDAFRPGLVVFLAGCDGAADDAIGNWKLTPEAMFERDRFVVELARAHAARLVVVLAGGYGEKAWRYSARFLAWLLSGTAIEPPDNEALTLLRFRQIKAGLDPVRLTSVTAHGGWDLTEDDLVGILPGVPRHTRFLEFFSKVGIELLLERFGILQQLRARGFKTPFVHLELEHELGQTLKIFGDPDRRELLVEVRVHRSTRAVPGCEVLEVEWLLLQNPHAAFAGTRRALPGQHHPGLGMLGELFGWLVVVSETLALDGLLFRPSHYHLAAVSRRHMRFLDPAAEAVMRALEGALAGLPLDEASRAVEEGRVVRAATGEPVRWTAPATVLPASERLRALTGGAAYEAAVRAAGRDLDLRLVAPPARV